jgi:hypothetical protein
MWQYAEPIAWRCQIELSFLLDDRQETRKETVAPIVRPADSDREAHTLSKWPNRFAA